jgi:hypothetical protein
MNYRISNNDELAFCFYKEFEVENQIKWQTFPDEEKCGGGYYDYVIRACRRFSMARQRTLATERGAKGVKQWINVKPVR